MITSPLLSNVRHRAMLTPVSPLHTRLIHISLSCWTIYHSFEIILKMGTVHWIRLQIQCSVQMHCFKKHSDQYELCFEKYLNNCIAQHGLYWMRPSMRERPKSRERPQRTVLFYSGHLQHERERPNMERRYINSDKTQRREPELTT